MNQYRFHHANSCLLSSKGRLIQQTCCQANKAKVLKTRTGRFVVYCKDVNYFFDFEIKTVKDKLLELEVNENNVIWVENYLDGDIAQRGAIQERAYKHE